MVKDWEAITEGEDEEAEEAEIPKLASVKPAKGLSSNFLRFELEVLGLVLVLRFDIVERGGNKQALALMRAN